MRTRRSLVLAAALALVAPLAAASFDEALYGRVLLRHTEPTADTARVRVDYAALGRAPEWRQVVASLSSVRPADLVSREERLAFWVNAYNVLAIDIVVRHYPIEGIKDIGSFFSPVWTREAGTIGGEAVTLDGIEHRILRPMGDPRIHMAIVCASTSCPALRREPYSAARVDAQLDDAVRAFLADPEKGLAFDRSRGRVVVSRIFDWFEEDFEAGGGVLAFVARYAPESDRAALAERRERLDVDYFTYDWALNDLRRTSALPLRLVSSDSGR